MTKHNIELANTANIVCNIIEFELIKNLKQDDEHAKRELKTVLNKMDQLHSYFEKRGRKKK